MLKSPEGKEASEKHGVIFLLYKDGKLQLEKRGENDKWFGYTIIPGGGIESGETQETALLREIQEEYDVTACEYKKLGVVDSTESDETLNFRHVFLVTNWEGKLSNPEGRNTHLEASLEVARLICIHPISKRILDLLPGQNG